MELMPSDTSFKCSICGHEGVAGITVHDFKFDEERTRIDWPLCPNCACTWGVRMINRSLTPDQYKRVLQIAGEITFAIHEDFYDDDGVAFQPR